MFCRKLSDYQENLHSYMNLLLKSSWWWWGITVIFMHQTAYQNSEQIDGAILAWDRLSKTTESLSQAKAEWQWDMPARCHLQDIAFFILSSETTGFISRPLSILSSWNLNWKPANMTYWCQAKITSAETVFTGESRWLDALKVQKSNSHTYY